MTESPEPQQITIMKRLVEMSAERSQMSAERTFMNAERTLSVWIRTALALMIFGIAIARFGLLLRQMPLPQSRGDLSANDLSSWGGSTLVALGVLMALSSGWRFLAYSITYRRVHALPPHHGPYMGPLFSLMVALFGIALLVILAAFTS